MKDLRAKGFPYKKIGSILSISQSTVLYHLNKEYKEKAISRSIKNQKPRDRKEYMRNYQNKKYKENEEFREKQKEASKKNWRKKTKTLK